MLNDFSEMEESMRKLTDQVDSMYLNLKKDLGMDLDKVIGKKIEILENNKQSD